MCKDSFDLKSETIPERRKFERYDVNVTGKIEIISQDSEIKKYDFETSNLSAEGTYLKFGRSLQEGSLVRVEIFLDFEEMRSPDNPNGTLIITATGSVLRSGYEGTAIHFNNDYDIMASGNRHTETYGFGLTSPSDTMHLPAAPMISQDKYYGNSFQTRRSWERGLCDPKKKESLSYPLSSINKGKFIRKTADRSQRRRISILN
ncbi:MAG: hypothetical protein CSYNP_01852 [Syntrophus sp. SKADARSKE-3]|nr:hypothetical protein [Syntrophus sp. SKADARSKE-3]